MKQSSFWNVDRQLTTWKYFLHSGNLRPYHHLHDTGPWPEKCQYSPVSSRYVHVVVIPSDLCQVLPCGPLLSNCLIKLLFAILLFLVCNLHHKACWIYVLIIFSVGYKLWSIWAVQFFAASSHFISHVQIFFTTLCSQSFIMYCYQWWDIS